MKTAKEHVYKGHANLIDFFIKCSSLDFLIIVRLFLPTLIKMIMKTKVIGQIILSSLSLMNMKIRLFYVREKSSKEHTVPANLKTKNGKFKNK